MFSVSFFYNKYDKIFLMSNFCIEFFVRGCQRGCGLQVIGPKPYPSLDSSCEKFVRGGSTSAIDEL